MKWTIETSNDSRKLIAGERGVSVRTHCLMDWDTLHAGETLTQYFPLNGPECKIESDRDKQAMDLILEKVRLHRGNYSNAEIQTIKEFIKRNYPELYSKWKGCGYAREGK